MSSGEATAPRARRTTLVFAAVSAVALLALAGGIEWRAAAIERRAADRAREAGRAGATSAANAIELSLRAVPLRVQDLRAALERGEVTPAEAASLLPPLLNATEIVNGYGVAFEPGVVAGTRLRAPYLERGPSQSMPLDTDLGGLYDYTEFKYGWYRNAMLDGAGWQETNIFPDTGDLTLIYAAPFTLPGGSRPSGVVFASLTMESVSRPLDGVGGSSGYTFVISREGRYLVHPREELVHGRSTIFQTALASGDTQLHTLGIRAIQGETVFAEALDQLTGRANWIVAAPVPTTGWSVFAVFFSDEFGPGSDAERHEMFLVITLAVLGLWLVAVALLAIRAKDAVGFIWGSSTALALAMAAGVAALWWAADRFPPALPEVRQVVLDEGSAHQFLENAGMDETGTAPRLIPTGVFVQAIKIDSGSEVLVSGYVWQRYELGRDDDVPRGFMLPEAFDASQSQVDEMYREKIGGEERIGWHFSTVFRQRFDYDRFPFDRQSVWVRLRPPALAGGIVFVPDYGAYDLMNPSLRPGVDSTIVLPGWEVTGSYFDYRMHRYNTSVGLRTPMRPDGYPELYFNVEMRRQFVGPFVTYIVPLGVTASMLFALLLISSRREAQEGMLGFSAAEIVLGAAALFFVVSFQHSALRDALTAENVIYFEYFFFGLYVLLMLVSLNAILFASHIEVALVEYQDNLIPKVAFWPLCLVTMFALTLVRFY